MYQLVVKCKYIRFRFISKTGCLFNNLEIDILAVPNEKNKIDFVPKMELVLFWEFDILPVANKKNRLCSKKGTCIFAHDDT